MLSERGKDFGGTTALDMLSCTIHAPEVVGLIGPNGAGKTTTMKLVLGLLRPSRGFARLGTLDCTKDARAVKGSSGIRQTSLRPTTF